MSNYNPPPIQNPIIEKEKEAFGMLSSIWIPYINQTFTGDTGTTFTPTYANLTVVGTPTVTGAYYKAGQFIDFEILITPATSTTSTGGSTYFQLPFTVFSATGGWVRANLGVDLASIATDGKVYTPNWSAITSPIVISGRMRGR